MLLCRERVQVHSRAMGGRATQGESAASWTGPLASQRVGVGVSGVGEEGGGWPGFMGAMAWAGHRKGDAPQVSAMVGGSLSIRRWISVRAMFWDCHVLWAIAKSVCMRKSLFT